MQRHPQPLLLTPCDKFRGNERREQELIHCTLGGIAGGSCPCGSEQRVVTRVCLIPTHVTAVTAVRGTMGSLPGESLALLQTSPHAGPGEGCMARAWTSQAVLDLSLIPKPSSLELCRGPAEWGRCPKHGPWGWPSAAIP